jgi:hypothetical protein
MHDEQDKPKGCDHMNEDDREFEMKSDPVEYSVEVRDGMIVPVSDAGEMTVDIVKALEQFGHSFVATGPLQFYGWTSDGIFKWLPSDDGDDMSAIEIIEDMLDKGVSE